MIDRETVWPLAVGAAVSVVLHAALLPWAAAGLQWTNGTPQRATHPPKVDRTLPAMEQIELGHDRSPIATVAWIDYEDFQELMARRSRTEQPALQREVDPLEHAPLELDPTPPAPPAPDLMSAPGAQPVDRLALSEPPLPPPPMMDLPVPEPVGQVPFAPPAPPIETPPSEAAPADQPQDQPPDQPPDQPTDQPPGEPSGESARPTAAPRAESEAAPTRLSDERFTVQPGGVITGPGIRIEVARPDISIVARSSTLPHNAQATLTFDGQGRVIDVALTRSTGAANYDGPIIASLYKWRASGERVEARNRPFVVDVTLILVEGER